jgi:hypothetical protein
LLPRNGDIPVEYTSVVLSSCGLPSCNRLALCFHDHRVAQLPTGRKNISNDTTLNLVLPLLTIMPSHLEMGVAVEGSLGTGRSDVIG